MRIISTGGSINKLRNEAMKSRKAPRGGFGNKGIGKDTLVPLYIHCQLAISPLPQDHHLFCQPLIARDQAVEIDARG